MKIGIFGGTFNPIHIGHLLTVEEVREKLNFNKVLFIPAYNPPHKSSIASYNHRRNMVALAIRDNPYFELCEIEKERRGKSWTVDTLRELRKYYPHDKLYLIIGSDQYLLLNTWKDPENLIRFAKLVIMRRASNNLKITSSKSKSVIDITQIDIASKDIRKKIKQTKSVRYHVRKDVYKYIINNELYI